MNKYAVRIETKTEIVHVFVEARSKKEALYYLTYNVFTAHLFQSSGTPKVDIKEIKTGLFIFAVVEK